jgi:hypothetical protein
MPMSIVNLKASLGNRIKLTLETGGGRVWIFVIWLLKALCWHEVMSTYLVDDCHLSRVTSGFEIIERFEYSNFISYPTYFQFWPFEFENIFYHRFDYLVVFSGNAHRHHDTTMAHSRFADNQTSPPSIA